MSCYHGRQSCPGKLWFEFTPNVFTTSDYQVLAMCVLYELMQVEGQLFRVRLCTLVYVAVNVMGPAPTRTVCVHRQLHVREMVFHFMNFKATEDKSPCLVMLNNGSAVRSAQFQGAQ